jgi:hypothetical protein
MPPATTASASTRASWTAACAVAALVLIVALAAGSRPLLGHSGSGAAVAARSGALTAVGIFAATVGVGAAMFFVGRPPWRKEPDERLVWTPSAPWWQQIVALAVVFVLLAALPLLFLIPGGASSPRRGGFTHAGQRSPAHVSRPATRSTPWAAVVFGVAGLVGFAGALGWLVWPVRVGPAREQPVPMEAAARAGRSALDAIANDRLAILAAYEAMVATLRERGVARRPSDAPRELLLRAVSHAPSSMLVHARTLTALFERARFADAPVGPNDRRDAEHALAALEDSR